MLADKNFRREGRYKVWNSIDLDTPQARDLFKLIAGSLVSLFHRRSPCSNANVETRTQPRSRGSGSKRWKRSSDWPTKPERRLSSVRTLTVPHAKRGWAYQRELELLVESGFTPMEAIVAGTMENARYFPHCRSPG
jgi:hypothetical protein